MCSSEKSKDLDALGRRAVMAVMKAQIVMAAVVVCACGCECVNVSD